MWESQVLLTDGQVFFLFVSQVLFRGLWTLEPPYKMVHYKMVLDLKVLYPSIKYIDYIEK